MKPVSKGEAGLEFSGSTMGASPTPNRYSVNRFGVKPMNAWPLKKAVRKQAGGEMTEPGGVRGRMTPRWDFRKERSYSGRGPN